MKLSGLDHYREVWVVDFEFCSPDGERPIPLCMVARELRTGQLIQAWQEDLSASQTSPVPPHPDRLFVAYYASAELACYLSLNWDMPSRILDLYTEFRCKTSGLPTPYGNGLLGALAYHGIDGIDADTKGRMRDLALRGGPHTRNEQKELLDYCQSDVDALAKLLPVMSKDIDLSRALLRGRYMAAVAKMEWIGVPIDVETWDSLQGNWSEIQRRLVESVDRDYNIYAGQTFKMDRFAEYLARNGIPWPQLHTGKLALDDSTFKTMARVFPTLRPLRELRKTLADLRKNRLTVGADGRNRCLISAFQSKTGRNQPSNARFVFGLTSWLRGLIRPGPDRAIAYVDYEQQEFGIAAALSGDAAMMDAYSSGDPYLTFAKQAGAAPPNATKKTHRDVRERFKVVALAVQYGMGAASLATSTGDTEAAARNLLRLHRNTYPRFWEWIHTARDHAMLTSRIHTVFGWPVHVGADANPRSLMNFPMQANGAEILRLACCELTEAGIDVCAPIHDAVLIESSNDCIQQTLANTQRIMQRSAELVLSGYPIRTEAKIVRHPDRYMDERGKNMWDTVMRILAELREKQRHHEVPTRPHGDAPTRATAASPVCLI